MIARREESLIARFEVTLEDLLAFTQYQLEHAPSVRRQRWAALAVPPLVWFGAWGLVIFYSADPAASAEKLWWLLLYAPLHFILFQRRWKRTQKGLLERVMREGGKSPLLGKRRVVLTALGIHEHNPFSEIVSAWTQVQKIERLEAHTLFFLSPTAAIILPKHAFTEERAYQEFVEAALRFHQGANGAIGAQNLPNKTLNK